LYRTTDPILGDAARVHRSAGDAAPYLTRQLYEMLDFRPPFDSLPRVEEKLGLVPPFVEGLADVADLFPSTRAVPAFMARAIPPSSHRRSSN